MANYPKDLVDLLEQYLTDGVMTAKEREVLLRKAEAMNVDKDEFDLEKTKLLMMDDDRSIKSISKPSYI